VYEYRADHEDVLNSSTVDCLIEFKTTSDQDPFLVKAAPPAPPAPVDSNNSNNSSDSSDSSDSRAGQTRVICSNPFMAATPLAHQVAGQITSYASLVMSAQYRTHLFTVLILKEYARLIRWDRGGALVTEPIYHDGHPHLLDFLIRFNDAMRAARGRDPTVHPANSTERRKVRGLQPFAKASSFLTITISDLSRRETASNLIICAPYAQPDIPAGRWTRTSIAYDVQAEKCVFLKDSWRIHLDDIPPEGETYARLHEHGVHNIAECSLAEDVGEERFHRTWTQDFNGKSGVLQDSVHFVAHRHYRLVLDKIGRKLESFACSKELVRAVYHALIGKFAVVSGLRAIA